MKIDRQIRDPIHGFIGLTKEECALLDTPALQRLRRVRQLAMASLVYPGALHTRFEHTLGVLHVAGQMCDKLEIDERHKPTVRLAALLHDAGHGPFSHVSESVLDAVAQTDLDKAAGKQDKIHELITRDIITNHAGFNDTLSRGERHNIVDLLDCGLHDPIHRAIISGPLDADKQDYLLRDSRYCGVPYGLFDIANLHNTLMAVDDGDQRSLMVERNGIHVLEQFVLAKYYLTTQVYRHKVRLITDQMLIRALKLGVQVDGIPFLRDLYVYSPEPTYAENYLAWDDNRLTQALLAPEHADTQAGRLFRSLHDRILHKRVCQVPVSDLPPAALIPSSEDFVAFRPKLEAAFADWLSTRTGVVIDPAHVIVHSYAIDSARKQSRNSEGSILVCADGGNPRVFEQESTLFRSIDEKNKEEFVECYAPVGAIDRKKRIDMADEARDFLVKSLTQLLPRHGARPEGDHP